MDHQYKAIDLERKACRLVRLLPGYYDTIQCKLFQAYLEDCPEYNALSYSWGSTEKSKSMQLDGRNFRVTENLLAALYELRSGGEDRIFWIDAICIDQSNDSERSHQVQQMREIYSQANKVIIWLGVATPETNIIMTAMKQLQTETKDCKTSSSKATDKHWVDAWHTAQCNIFTRYGITKSQPYDCIPSLFKRDWFQRIWILQEAANARSASVMCGSKVVSRDVFRLMPDLLGFTPEKHCQAVLNLFTPSWKHEDRTLRTLLRNFRQSKATDPMDMIYALIGMSSDAPQSDFLKVDYSKTLERVIADTVSFILSLHSLGYQIREHGAWCRLSTFQYMLDRPLSAMLNWAISRDSQLAMKLCPIGYATELSPQNLLLLSVSSRGNMIDVEKLVAERNDVDVNVRDEAGRTPLMLAIEKGHEETVGVLITRRNIDLDIRDPDSRSVLMLAVESGHEGIVEMLLGMNGIDVHETDFSKQTAFHYAARSGNATIAAMLLENTESDISGQLCEDGTPLTLAARYGNVSVLRKFFEHQDDFGFVTTETNSLLHLAMTTGNAEIAQVILQRAELDPNSTDSFGRTALHLSIEYGSTAVVKMLLQYPNINAGLADSNARTPLLVAARNGQREMIELLLKRSDVNINSIDRSGKTALSSAVDFGCSEAAQMLCQHPDINVGYGRINYPKLLWTAVRHGQGKIVEFLLEHINVNINSRDWDGETALQLSSRLGNITVAQILLQHPDINADLSDMYQNTPLWKAARHGHKEIVELLLRRPDVDINSRDRNGETALNASIRGENITVAQILLQHPDINAGLSDIDNRTPLWTAARHGHNGIVELLLRRPDVDINSRSKMGRTPLMVAKEFGHYDIMNLIEQANGGPDQTSQQGESESDQMEQGEIRRFPHKNSSPTNPASHLPRLDHWELDLASMPSHPPIPAPSPHLPPPMASPLSFLPRPKPTTLSKASTAREKRCSLTLQDTKLHDTMPPKITRRASTGQEGIEWDGMARRRTAYDGIVQDTASSDFPPRSRLPVFPVFSPRSTKAPFLPAPRPKHQHPATPTKQENKDATNSRL